MDAVLTAVYENGMLRLDQPIPIPDGTPVSVTIVLPDEIDGDGLAASLTRIAALPAEGEDDGFSGADHDCILYARRQPK